MSDPKAFTPAHAQLLASHAIDVSALPWDQIFSLIRSLLTVLESKTGTSSTAANDLAVASATSALQARGLAGLAGLPWGQILDIVQALIAALASKIPATPGVPAE